MTVNDTIGGATWTHVYGSRFRLRVRLGDCAPLGFSPLPRLSILSTNNGTFNKSLSRGYDECLYIRQAKGGLLMEFHSYTPCMSGALHPFHNPEGKDRHTATVHQIRVTHTMAPSDMTFGCSHASIGSVAPRYSNHQTVASSAPKIISSLSLESRDYVYQ